MPPPSKNPPARTRTATGQGPAARARRPAPVAAPRPVAKLVCSAGPASGQEFELTEDEVTIGRATDATVSVPDTSVSRKHALVRKTDEGWAVSDLGSGNGTLVNGEAVGEERLLSSDDVITLGDSEFQFVGGEGAAPAQDALVASARRPPVRTARTGGGAASRPRTSRAARLDGDPVVLARKKRRLLVAAATVLVVLLAFAVGGKAIENKKLAAERAKAAIVKEQRDALLGEFQTAKKLIVDGRFDEARQTLESVQAQDDEVRVLKPDEKKSVSTYLETANREVPNEQLFTDAGKALAADELAQASTLLGKVKTKIPATEKRLETLRATLETRLGEKVIDARKKLASAPRDLATMEQVKAMAEDVLTARPEDRDAPDIKKQADDNIARIKNPNLPPPAPDTPHLEVMNRFRNGDQSGAVSLAQACAARSAQCRSLEAQLREFDAKFKGLEGLSSADLWALYVLDKKIAGGQSSDLAKPIKTKVSSVFMLEASRSKTVGDWVRAIGSARKVLEVDAQHPAANAIIQDARTKANDIYLRGYQLKDSSADEAAKLFKEVLAMTPEDDTAHQKAKSRLDELQRQ